MASIIRSTPLPPHSTISHQAKPFVLVVYLLALPFPSHVSVLFLLLHLSSAPLHYQTDHHCNNTTTSYHCQFQCCSCNRSEQAKPLLSQRRLSNHAILSLRGPTLPGRRPRGCRRQTTPCQGSERTNDGFPESDSVSQKICLELADPAKTDQVSETNTLASQNWEGQHETWLSV